MVCAFCAVRNSPQKWELRVIDEVGAAGELVDFRASHSFNGDAAGERPKVRVCYPWVGCLDWLEKDACVLETGIGRVATFSFISHSSSIRASRVGFGVMCAY